MTNKQNNLCTFLGERGITVNNPEDYKNVDSVLNIVCANGHRQTNTVGYFQKNDWECIDCIRDSESNPKPQKGYLLALDAATNTTGWAVLNKNGQLLHSGYFEAGRKLPLMERIKLLLEEIRRLIAEYDIKVVAIEDTQMENNTLVFKTLSMLRGILLYFFDSIDMPIYSSGADVWRSFSNIRGSTRAEKKEATMARAKLIYGRDFEEDEADAVFLGKYAYAQMDQPDEEIEELISFGGESQIEKIK